MDTTSLLKAAHLYTRHLSMHKTEKVKLPTEHGQHAYYFKQAL